MKKAHVVTLACLLVSLLPSAVFVRSALADDDPDSAEGGEAMSSEELAKKQRQVLKAIPTDDTVLINVSERDMPASPDILNLGRTSGRALARCVSDNVDDRLRATCAELLGRLGEPAGLDALRGALEAWDANVRGSAISALRKIPHAGNVEPLAKILAREDETPANRAAALEALGAQSSGRAVRLLQATLRRPPADESELRVAAFKGLWRSRHLVDRPALVADVSYALAGDNALVLAGTFAASELRAPELVPALVKLMRHGDTRIRNRAVYALGKIGDKTATHALLEQVPHVRESRMLNNIAFALERLDPKAFYGTAGQLVRHKQAQIRMNAAFVIGDVRRPEGLPLLQSALGDKNDVVRVSAVTAIGKLSAPEGEKLLERYVDDPNASLRQAAITAIYALSGNKRTDLVFQKLYAVPETKLEGALLLARAKDPRVTEDVLSCIESRGCALSDVEPFLRTSPSPDVPGRTLLAWVKGRSDLTDLVATLKPAGTGPLAKSEIQASLARKNLPRSLTAIDLTGDVTDAHAEALLGSLLTHENTRLRVHAAVALAREGLPNGAAAVFREMDNLPEEQLPSLVRLLSRVSEPAGRAQLLPGVTARLKNGNAAIAVSAAAVRMAWEPEAGVFRMLEALAAPTRLERDLAERYLVHDERPIVTELLRRALARESRAAVRDQLRRILDVRADALRQRT